MRNTVPITYAHARTEYFSLLPRVTGSSVHRVKGMWGGLVTTLYLSPHRGHRGVRLVLIQSTRQDVWAEARRKGHPQGTMVPVVRGEVHTQQGGRELGAAGNEDVVFSSSEPDSEQLSSPPSIKKTTPAG